MRQFVFPTTAFAAATVLLAGMLTPVHAQQPKSGQTPPAAQQKVAAPAAAPRRARPATPQQGSAARASAPPMPYKPVAIQLPQPVKDARFEAFRKQVAALAQKKDRAGLARVVSKNFYWIQQDNDGADKKKSGIENLSKAIGLDGKDAQGWEALVAFAADPTGEPDPQHKGAICAPADPVFDDKAAEELANATKTDSPSGATRWATASRYARRRKRLRR